VAGEVGVSEDADRVVGRVFSMMNKLFEGDAVATAMYGVPWKPKI
jgi:hypothetical protein